MGVIVDLLDEIRNRLETATGVGKDLEGIKRVRIGSIEEARKLNNYPIINIKVTSPGEEPRFVKSGSVIELSIEIRLMVNKLAEEKNKYFKISDSTGALFLLENMLNVLDKDTSGNLDLTFNCTGNNLRRYSWDMEESNQLVEIPVTMNIETKQFILGQR